MIKFCILSLLVCFTQIAYSQQNKLFDEPEMFITDSNYQAEVLNPILSSDGNTMYFAQAFHPKNSGGEFAGTDIWYTQKDSLGKWSIPKNDVNKWNNQDNNAVIGIREDDEVVFLLNSYKKGSGISFSKKIGGNWSTPDFISIPWHRWYEFCWVLYGKIL